MPKEMPTISVQDTENLPDKEPQGKNTLPEKEFLVAKQRFNDARKTSDFNAMVSDILVIINGWDDKFSQELLREAYPNWRRKDFIRLLNELGVETQEPDDTLGRKSIAEMDKIMDKIKKQEKIKEILLEQYDSASRILQDKLPQLKSQLDGLHRDLSGKEVSLKMLLSPEDIVKQQTKWLQYALESKENAEKVLKDLGFFKRYFSKEGSIAKDYLNRTVESIIHEQQELDKLQNLSESDLEEQRKQYEKNKEALETAIKELESQIKQTEEELKKTETETAAKLKKTAEEIDQANKEITLLLK